MRSPTLLSALLVTMSTLFFACTKIEYTTLGGNLVPEVDNINTFDTTLDVITENFQQSDDTTKLYYNDQLVVGQIINDPLFGPTNAAIYFEMKPTSFSAYATAKNFIDSSLTAIPNGYDSTVLSLKFDGGYGDSTQDIRFEVYTIALNDTLRRLQDTIYALNRSFRTEALVGTKTVSLKSLLRDSISVSRSSILSYKKTMELRIPLSDVNDRWKNLLRDTLALADESVYRTKFAGFAIKAVPVSTTGSLAYFSISDTATKLQFYYRRKNAGVIDTTNTNFYFNPNNSGYANNVDWTRGRNSEIARYLTPGADSFIYVKANPGTQVRIRIPGLENVSNRIIHRAELKTYIIPDNATIDGFLAPPPVMYLERYDTSATNSYLPIPRDLSPNELYGNCFPSTNGINYGYFGGYPRTERLNNIDRQFYAFNVSQYVQQIVTHQLLNSPLRLTANMNAQYAGCLSGVPFRATNNIISYGRAKLGGGGLRGTYAPYKMRLRIIYSRI